MKEIEISSVNEKYNVYIDNNLDQLFNALWENKVRTSKTRFLITDENIYKIYKDKINNIASETDIKIHVIKPGEENKTYSTVEEIYNFLLENGATRKSVLMALGGGVVGDITGFVAATYMRGIEFVNIPTTLIAISDSSIGGKVGYNFNGLKNSIGTFYNPKFVYVAVNLLKTLSKAEFISGMSEVIKYGIILQPEFLKYLSKNSKQIMEYENDKLIYIAKECIKMKAQVVKQDFKDNGYRNILNFGHTIAHGIEYVSNHEVLHGEAVALGILVELKISELVLNLNPEVYKEVLRVYNAFGLNTHYSIDNIEAFMYAIKHDKKNLSGHIMFSLIEELGKPKLSVAVSEKIILKSLKETIGRRIAQ